MFPEKLYRKYFEGHCECTCRRKEDRKRYMKRENGALESRWFSFPEGVR